MYFVSHLAQVRLHRDRRMNRAGCPQLGPSPWKVGYLDAEALRDDQPRLGIAAVRSTATGSEASHCSSTSKRAQLLAVSRTRTATRRPGIVGLEVLDEPAGQELGQALRGRLEGQDLVQVAVVELGVQELLERGERAEVRDEAGLLQRGSGEDDLDLVAVPVLAGALVLGRQAGKPVAGLEARTSCRW